MLVKIYFSRFNDNLKRQGGSFSSTVQPKLPSIQQPTAGSDVVLTSDVLAPDARVKIKIETVDELCSIMAVTSDHIMSVGELRIGEMKTEQSDNNDEFVVTTASTSDHIISVGELRMELCNNNVDLCQFIYVKNNAELTFVKISNHKNPQVELSIVITDEFDVLVNVRGKELKSVDKLFGSVPIKFDTTWH